MDVRELRGPPQALDSRVLEQSLQSSRSMARVRIYTSPSCGYCWHAKRLFADKGVPFEEVDVAVDYETRRWLAQTTGKRTVPQIFIDDKPYGGFTDVALLDRQGRLDTLLGLDAA